MTGSGSMQLQLTCGKVLPPIITSLSASLFTVYIVVQCLLCTVGLVELEETLEVVATTSHSLQGEQQNLTSSLNVTRNNLLVILDKPQCNLTESCITTLESVRNIGFIADYSKVSTTYYYLDNSYSAAYTKSTSRAL